MTGLTEISESLADLAAIWPVYESLCAGTGEMEQNCIRCAHPECRCIIINGYDADFRALHLMSHHGYTMDGQLRL